MADLVYCLSFLESDRTPRKDMSMQMSQSEAREGEAVTNEEKRIENMTIRNILLEYADWLFVEADLAWRLPLTSSTEIVDKFLNIPFAPPKEQG